MSDTTPDKSVVRTAGRGVIYITFAKMWFMLSGWALVFILPRVFKWSVDGDDEKGMALYGAYGIVFTGVSFLNNGIITGTIQSVSRFTSADEAQAGSIRKTALLVQGGIGLALGAAYAGIAGLLAHFWFRSPGLTNLMRLSAGVIVAYSCYAVFIGSFNGLRRFHRQALFDIAYSTLKTVLIIGFVLAGFEVLGAVIGFLIAAIVIALLSGVASRVPLGEPFAARKYLGFAWVLILYTFVLNLVMMLDLYILSGMVSRLVVEAGGSAADAASLVEMRAGQYKAVQQLAFIPYQAVIAIAFVIFPLISKVTAMNDEEKARVYVRKTLRFTAILIVGLATIFAALPQQAMGLVFPPEYGVAAPALRILPVGICAFGLMVVGNTILNGAGHPWRAMLVVLAGLVAVIGGVVTTIYATGSGTGVLGATAVGTSVGMGVALLVCGVLVYRRFKTFWPWLSMLRIVIAAGVAVGAGHFLPVAGKFITLLECVGVLVVYLVVLVVTREFDGEDLAQLKQVLKRG